MLLGYSTMQSLHKSERRSNASHQSFEPFNITSQTNQTPIVTHTKHLLRPIGLRRLH